MTGPEDPPQLVIAGRYRVIRQLGRGGMGTVYEAENLRTRRRVALKTMRPEVSNRADFVRRFEREAQAAGQLRHPNVIDVLDLGDDPEIGLVFIVQEFLEGGDLGACLKRVGTLAPHAAIATLLPVMDALEEAHRRGVVHRDIKPDNIFLHETAQGVVPKVIDFGIAKVTTAEGDLSQTTSGHMVGSPNYMSPEQALADRALDGRTDVWSMGVVLYRCLAGAMPYRAPSANAMLAKIIYEEPTELAGVAPQLPADLVAVVRRALAKDREARWPSMRAFADALQACALWRGVDAERARRWVTNVLGESRETPPMAPAPPPPPPSIPPPPEATSELSSGQRSGPWRGEVPVRATSSSLAPRTPHRLAGLVGGAGLVVMLTAGLFWVRRPAGAPPVAPVHGTSQAPRPSVVVAAEPAPPPAATAPVEVTPPVAQRIVEAPVAAPTPTAVPVDRAPVAVRDEPGERAHHPTTAPRPANRTPRRRGSNNALILQ